MSDYFPCEISGEEEILPNIKEIEKIYTKIHHPRSKLVFTDRLMYSFTMDEKFLWDMIRTKNITKDFISRLDGNLYIYGAGKRGRELKNIFYDKEWLGFIDKERTGYIDNIPIFGTQHIQNINRENIRIIISIKNGYKEVMDELISQGVNKENIILLSDYFSKWCGEIYFDERCLEGITNCDGMFLDIGCYDGNDTIRAINHYKYSGFKVNAFEPDPASFKICRDNLKYLYDQVELFPYAVSSEVATVRFKEDGTGSRIDAMGHILVDTVTIDDHVKNNKVGFIKMDIEGFEEQALEGGRATIKRDRPVLALSVYHKRSDIWRLPLKVLEICSEYHFEFEHHFFSWGDTVMYAIPNQ